MNIADLTSISCPISRDNSHHELDDMFALPELAALPLDFLGPLFKDRLDRGLIASEVSSTVY